MALGIELAKNHAKATLSTAPVIHFPRDRPCLSLLTFQLCLKHTLVFMAGPVLEALGVLVEGWHR